MFRMPNRSSEAKAAFSHIWVRAAHVLAQLLVKQGCPFQKNPAPRQRTAETEWLRTAFSHCCPYTHGRRSMPAGAIRSRGQSARRNPAS